VRLCVVDAGKPKRRLADPGLTLEHERGRPLLIAVDERAERGELFLSANDVRDRRARRQGYVMTI
jgi:hypothetical protein